MRCLTINVSWLDFMNTVLNILKRLSSRLKKHLAVNGFLAMITYLRIAQSKMRRDKKLSGHI